MNWHTSTFSPKNCGLTINASAVTVGSGTQMRELYRAASDRNYMIVGGSSTTVSVGGYLTGGGHSPLSPLFGMGADNVMELEIVTADGELVVANECQNTDLFWAVRGVCTQGISMFIRQLTLSIGWPSIWCCNLLHRPCNTKYGNNSLWWCYRWIQC
jgi:FAD/FMN-containing dehydrogenase